MTETNYISIPAGNYKTFVFDDSHKKFNPNVPGFNKTHTFLGNTLITGDIPPFTLVNIIGGAALIATDCIGASVKVVTTPINDECREDVLQAARELFGETKVEPLFQPVHAVVRCKNAENPIGQLRGANTEELIVNPCDVFIESSGWADRSTFETAFDGDIIGHKIAILGEGTVMFNGNTAPLTHVAATGDCAIEGSTGVTTTLDVGGPKGVRAHTFGAVTTVTAYGNIDVINVGADCALSSNGSGTIGGTIGDRSAVLTTGGILLSSALLHNLSPQQRFDVLRRLTSSGKIQLDDGRRVKNMKIARPAANGIQPR